MPWELRLYARAFFTNSITPGKGNVDEFLKQYYSVTRFCSILHLWLRLTRVSLPLLSPLSLLLLLLHVPANQHGYAKLHIKHIIILMAHVSRDNSIRWYILRCRNTRARAVWVFSWWCVSRKISSRSRIINVTLCVASYLIHGSKS